MPATPTSVSRSRRIPSASRRHRGLLGDRQVARARRHDQRSSRAPAVGGSCGPAGSTVRASALISSAGKRREQRARRVVGHARDEHAVAAIGDALRDRDDLLGRLARRRRRLRESPAGARDDGRSSRSRATPSAPARASRAPIRRRTDAVRDLLEQVAHALASHAAAASSARSSSSPSRVALAA